MKPPIELHLPGQSPQSLAHLVLDYTGTLSLDGRLLPGVAQRLTALAGNFHIVVLTADTFGKARQELAGLPLELRIISTGRDKADFVRELGDEKVVTIGNGRNDVPMMKIAGLGIAVMGPEGAAGELLAAAKIVVRDILEALNLLANPLRLKATLRD